MTVQTVPYVEQNLSHSAALFRQSASAPWATGGLVVVGELAIAAQTTPAMSIQVGAGRAKIPGTQVSAPTLLSGATAAFTTQGYYDLLNDATLSLTVSSSDPTNPRIDAVYVGVQDSFYSGGVDGATAGIVTGTPASSPVAPAIPSNSILLGTIAVAANATSIVSGNIAAAATTATMLGQNVVFSTAGITMGTNWTQGTGMLALRIYRTGNHVHITGALALGASGGGGGYSSAATFPTSIAPTATKIIGVSNSSAAITSDVTMTSAGVLAIGQSPGFAGGSLPFSNTCHVFLDYYID